MGFASRRTVDAMASDIPASSIPAPSSSSSSPLASAGSHCAVVTGASAGIGRATVVALRQAGWEVIAVARRAEKLEALAAETGCRVVAADITSDVEVDRIVAAAVDAEADTLINIAGGARGQEPVAEADLEHWQWMYNNNVIGTLKLTKALLGHLRAVDGGGTVLNLTSTAGIVSYEGGAGYNAAKSAERALTQVLRLEEAENNVRVIEVLPGMVATEEFSLRRFGGDQQRADAVYEGVENPLTAEDVASVVSFAVNAPHHVNIDEVVIRPVAQAAQHKVIRGTLGQK